MLKMSTVCFEKAYNGGGDGKIGTTERGHILEKFGKHSATGTYMSHLPRGG